jgi:hypothetical protein
MLVGLALTIWPSILDHTSEWPLMSSVVASMLAGVSTLAALGIRYPLQMLPLLLFELVWKSIWLVSVAVPLYLAGELDAQARQTVFDCLLGVVLMPIVIPWPYVVSRYVKQTGDRWKAAGSRVSREGASGAVLQP